jgi:hypothetical protein
LPSSFRVGAGFSTLLGNLACILRHPDIHDAKIGSLQTLLPHLPPLIEQPAFGQLQIANELRKRGLTVSCRVLNEVRRDFGCTSWASRAGAPRGVRQLCSCRNPGAYLKLDGNGASSRLLRFRLKAPTPTPKSAQLASRAPARAELDRQPPSLRTWVVISMISGAVSVGQLSRRGCRLFFTRTSAQSDDRTICRRCADGQRSSTTGTCTRP